MTPRARLLLLAAASAVALPTAVLAPAPVHVSATTTATTTAQARPQQAAATVRADSGATITKEEQLDERTFDLTVSSPALGQDVKVRVLVPAGWSRNAARTWPVVYAYHGGRDTYVSWTRSTDIEELSAQYDTMVVMPEAADGAYADWWNYGQGGTPKWETFHTQEVLQLVERNYRAGQTRAAIGISSGASGAMTYAGRHPGMFRYVASASGIMHMTKPGIPSIILFIQGFFTNAGDPFRVWGIPILDHLNWMAHDPFELAQKLRGTGLYVSTGTTGLPGPYDKPAAGEEDSVQVQEVLCGTTTKDFLERLKAFGIPVTSHVYSDGWHNWEAWQPEMHRFWPLVMASLGVQRNG